MSEKQIDCCGEPSLQTVKTFVSTDELLVRVRRCVNCGAHWYCHVQAYALSSGDYDRCKWYVRLSPEEAAALLQAPDVPTLDRFDGRPGFLRDGNGLCRIQGIPDFLQQ